MTVTVTGSAQRAVAPGAATWRAEAVESDDDPRTAFERCSTRLNSLVERLSAVGEVATEAVVVQPRFEEAGAAGAEAIGAVRVRSPAARAADVAQAAMSAGADRLQGPHFEYEQRERGPRRAAGRGGGRRPRQGRAAGRRGRPEARARRPDRGDRARARAGLQRAMAATAEPPDVRPRELTVTATVRVVFAFDD